MPKRRPDRTDVGVKLVPFGDVRRAAEARADEDVRKAIVEARAALHVMPEYVTLIDDQYGRHINMPVYAMAEGMLAHLEESYARNHATEK